MRLLLRNWIKSSR